MIFHEFGEKNEKTILLMHGMLNDWHCVYEYLHFLEEDYHLIIPAGSGLYPDSSDFVSFADECSQIEKYVDEHFGGRLTAMYGISQGATLMSELLARNNIQIEYAFLDGIYLAHQGKLAGELTYRMMKKAKRYGGKFSKSWMVSMKLMGLTKEDMVMMSCIYWDVSDESMHRNCIENYTYRVNPAISDSNAKVYLWCGSKEPYALKSHRILKRHLESCTETVWQGMGHGKMFYFNGEKLCRDICDAIEQSAV